MKAYKETVRKYYKYVDTSNVLLNLYNSNNTSYIDSSTKHFVVNSVTAWSTTQTYKLNSLITAKDILVTSNVIYIQANCGWSVKVSAITESGQTVILFEQDHGYGQQTTLTKNTSFNPLEKIVSIVIYANCYRRSAQYCYGSIDIGLTFTNRQVTEGTSSDYVFYEDVDEYKLVKETVREYYDEIVFESSSSLQEWTVPYGITKIHVDCVASSGYGTNAGLGGRVECDLSVTGGQTLYIMVGGVPTSYWVPQYGAADIRTDNTGITDTTSLQSRLIVAGAGGCTYWTGHGPSAGGNGGGLEALAGGNTTGANGGGGGTQSAGGSAGSGGSGSGGAGTLGLGGGVPYYGSEGRAGAGGAGYYGGGGGGYYARNRKWFYAGGGGGSSYTSSNCSNVVHTQGYQNGAGYIKLTTLNGEHFYKEMNEYKAFNI